MENFQIELLEIEFNAFSHGFKKISDLDFAEILLRYTEFNRDAKKAILKRVKKTSTESSVCLRKKQPVIFLSHYQIFL